MTDEELQAVLDRIADEPLCDPAPSSDLRSRHIDAMLARGGAAPRRARLRPLVVALVATSVAAPAFALWHTRRVEPIGTLQAAGSALVLRKHEAVLVDATKTYDLRPGERVVTLTGGTAVAAVDGAIATLSPRGELSIASAPGVSCELRTGRARFVVAKRVGRPPFVVRAADVDVAVRGTAFEVWLDLEGRAHVRVDEGSVAVGRHGEAAIELHPGQSLPEAADVPSRDAPPLSGASGPFADVDARPHTHPHASHPRAASATPPSAHPSSTLASEKGFPRVLPPASSGNEVPSAPASQLREQNDLLWEAAEARRRGDLERERRALDAFDRRFPNAPGSHDARAAALRRALASGDRAAAKEAARAYLAAHPDGPLRSEALAVD